MDVGAVLIQLKPNFLTHVEAWQAELNNRKNEALETLQAEGVFVESWFYFGIYSSRGHSKSSSRCEK